jgi:replication-associated recombination protein RarA
MRAKERKPLYERYRPATWAEVVGQEKVVGRLQAMTQRDGIAGHAFWISGASGTGKTTIAKLLAAEVADDWSVEEVDAGDCTPARLKDMERGGAFRGFGDKGGRVYIINEAHGLRKDAVRLLLTMLERIPGHCTWIFTTTNEGQEKLFDDCIDASPLLSRCIEVMLKKEGMEEAFAARAKQIAVREGLDGEPYERYLELVRKHKCNFRGVLSAVEAGEMVSGS